MVKIALRVYNNEISDLVDHGHLDEAIAHCRHILEFYPRLIDTYRLFGKSFLEAKQYNDAADIFQRVISSIPEDFVSQIGMSIIRENEGKLNAAIYHMERTFEFQPSNQAIQEELRRLYGQRDGIEPAKIRLTRGALARMYAHGNLFEQAVAELTSALAEDPARIDLSVLMAEMYYRMDKHVEAADISINILQKLPNNLSANKILFYILKGSNRKSEADVYKHRWISLDPYVEFIDDDNPDPSQVQDSFVTIDKLEWDPSEIENPIETMDGDTTQGISKFGKESGPNQNWLFAAKSNEDEEEDQYFENTDLENLLSDETPLQNELDTLSDNDESDKPELELTKDSDDIPDWIMDGEDETMEKEDNSLYDDPELNADDENESEMDLDPAGDDLSEKDLPDWMQSGILNAYKDTAETE